MTLRSISNKSYINPPYKRSRAYKCHSEADQILIETAFVDLIQTMLEFCNRDIFTSFKAELRLEDADV